MLKRLSDTSDELLTYYLDRIREIAVLGDEAALIETDKLLWEFTEYHEENYDPDFSPGDVPAGPITPTFPTSMMHDFDRPGGHASYLVRKLQRRMESGSIYFYDLDNLRDLMERGQDRISQAPSETISEREKVARSEQEAFLEQAVNVLFEHTIKEGESGSLSSISSARRVFLDLSRVEEEYKKYPSLPADTPQRIRAAQERVARLRHDRLLAKADVAAASGRTQAAKGFRAEATAVLKQDWAEFFPDEMAPVIANDPDMGGRPAPNPFLMIGR